METQICIDNAKCRLERYFQFNPDLKHRKFRKQFIEDLSELDYDQYKFAATIDRYFRKLPRDGGEHDRETECLEKLGYDAKNIHDFA